MASTYSTNLALELIGTGDQAGTWGTTTNTNLGTLIEQAVSGYVTQAITDGADTVITIPNGATGVARNMFIECTGTLTAARNLVVPANKKLYFIYNNTTGGYAVIVKVSGQTGVSVPNGSKFLLVSNGTDIVNATSFLYTGGPLGTPSSGTVTNLTGTASININGTVGATTPTTGAFTTLAASSDFSVATSKFTVAAASGNTAVAGTLGVTGDTTVGAGSGSPILHINSAASGTANTGPVLKFERNGAQKGIISNRAWLLAGGSTADDMAYYAESGLGHYFYANGSTTAVTAITSTGLVVTGTGSYTSNLTANVPGATATDYGVLVDYGVATGAVPNFFALKMYNNIQGAIGLYTTDTDNGDLTFSTRLAGTLSRKMTLDSSGNLLVGTTSTLLADRKLQVLSGSSDVAVFKTDATVSSQACLVCWNSSTSGDNLFLGFFTESSITSRGSITYNRGGGVVAYNTTSDYRAKDIDGPLTNSGEVIDALKVYKGTMKGATIARPMLIAHEAQEHVPYAVTGEKDAVNDSGNPVYQTMDHQILVPLLIAEIQSLRARVAALEAK